MKKKILSAFFLTFISSFLFYGIVSEVLLVLPVRISELGELILVLASVPFLLGLAVAYSISQLGTSEEATFVSEVAEGADTFVKAFTLLKSKAFFPVWVTLGLSIFGILLIQLESAILGVVAIFAAQVWWFSSRRKMHTLVDSKNVATSMETILRFFIYLIDAFCALITFTVLGVLSQYAQITNPAKIMGLSLVVSIALVTYWYRVNRFGFEIFFGVQVVAVFFWVLLVSMAANFGFDFREPTSVHTVTFGDCPNRKNEYFTNRNEKIDPILGRDRFVGCEIFNSSSPSLEDKAETIHHTGALGISWKKTRLLH